MYNPIICEYLCWRYNGIWMNIRNSRWQDLGSLSVLWHSSVGGGKLAGHIQCFYSQTGNIPSSPSGQRTFTGCSLREAPCLGCLWGRAQPGPQVELVHAILLKMLEKWSIPCTAPVGTWLLLLSSTFKTGKSGKKWSTAAIYGQELTSPHFPVSIWFKDLRNLLQWLSVLKRLVYHDAS